MAATVVAVTIAVVVVVAACDVTPAVTLPFPPAAAPTTPAQPLGAAASALAALPVKGRAPKTGYARAQFGPAWADTDHDGCDQRNQVLGRDLTDIAVLLSVFNGVTIALLSMLGEYVVRTLNAVSAHDTYHVVERVSG